MCKKDKSDFFVRHLSPLKPKACAAKIDFFSLMQVVAF